MRLEEQETKDIDARDQAEFSMTVALFGCLAFALLILIQPIVG